MTKNRSLLLLLLLMLLVNFALEEDGEISHLAAGARFEPAAQRGGGQEWAEAPDMASVGASADASPAISAGVTLPNPPSAPIAIAPAEIAPAEPAAPLAELQAPRVE